MVTKRLHGYAVAVAIRLTGLRTGTAETVTKLLLPIQRGTSQITTASLLPAWVGI
jgi:hypothetical protein